MRFILAILLLLLPAAGFAQESDKDFLTRYLEENLSDAGRVVTVTGFVGALSSQATMQQMTIADDQGVWLTLKGVTLDWSRSALLSGQIDVNEFTVDEIDLERIPSTKSKMPSAEAKGFSLPNLPVSINLKDIAAKRIVLGAAVLGQKVEGTLTASALLAGGQGVANLTLVRTDAGPKGKFTFIGSYANATGQLSLALTASEDAGGVAVGLLGVPGSPSADLIIGGTGPITDFTANVSLKTDGVSRLAGKVTLTGDDKGNSFAVDLAGDPTPVFLPQYAAFFGPNVHLTAKGQRLADGSTALSQLQIRTQALSLDGSLSLDALGAPAAFNLTGRLGLADGALVLPMKGSQETRLNHADVSLTYDRSKGDAWQGKAVVAGLDQAALTATTMTLEGNGHISRDAVGQLFDGQITFAADGLAMKDPGLAQALGTALDGQVDLKWTHGDARLSVSNLAIKGDGFRVSTTGGIAGLGDGFALKGNAQGQYDDLSRLSTLAGRPLAGLVSFDLSGDGSPLSGFFDGKGSLNGKDLSVGVSQLDGLLRGDSAISLDLRRDATGTTVRALEVTTTTLKATAQGRLTSEGNSLGADLDFSDLSVLGANYHGALKGKGSLVGSFDKGTASLQATGTNLAVGQPQADLLLAGESTLSVSLTLADGVAVIDTAVITNPQLTLDATGRLAAADNDVTAKLTLPDLSVLGGTYRGALQGQARLTGTLDAAVVSLDGTGTDLAVGQDLIDRLLQGQSTVSITAKIENGAAVVDHAVVSTPQFSIDATGRMASVGSDFTASLTLPNLAVLGAAYSGAVLGKAHLLGDMNAATITLDGTATNLALGQPQLDGLLTGQSTLAVAVKLDKGLVAINRAVISNPHLSIDVTGTLAAAGSDVTAKLALTDLSGISAAYSGAATGEAHFTGQPTDGHLSVTASSSNLAMGQHLLDTLLRGQSTLLLDLDLTTVGVKINEAKLVTPQITAEATGTANGAERRLQLTARLGNLAVLYPQFPGALTAIGTAVQSDAGYQIDLAAKGPGQIDASVKGSLANNFRTADLAISGTATAALANEIAAPRSLSGPLRFDLRLRGPLKLSSLSGPVSLTGGRLADPAQTFAVQDIAGQFQLAGGTAQIKLNAGVSTGGSVVVTGSVGLDAPYPADLAIQIQNVKLRDPELYSTTANGAVTFKGPAIGGAVIAGSIDLGQTEIRIPSTGLGANGDLPGLEHVHEPADVHATRVRAGLLGTTGSGRGAAGGYALNLKISAPNQVFIRGRGLDAELGGSLVLRGTTQAIVPSGAFNLIRGRLDILGRRLVLTDAMLQLQGALIPFVRILASVESDGITSSVLIEGDANDPQVTFTSSPDLPQEEVIARLLFDRGLGTLTAFQAIQLASAVAALAGRGGEGVIGNLRKQAGLDNLDVQTDASGNAQITAGKYLSEKIYSEVTVDAGGNSDVSLNLDITKNITLKGHVDTDGNTGIGLFVQKDY